MFQIGLSHQIFKDLSQVWTTVLNSLGELGFISHRLQHTIVSNHGILVATQELKVPEP